MAAATPFSDLAGKKALITGGSRGIGAATAVLLAQCGADVAVGYRSRSADADRVVAEIGRHGVRGFAFAADVSSASGAERLVDRAADALGEIDIFVGNAGVWPAEETSIASMDPARWSDTLRENLDSIFFTTRAVIPVVRDSGRIVLVSSTAGQRGEAFHADYAATKGGVIAFTKSIAIELAPRRITANAVAPGWVDTEMVADAIADSGRARIESSIPIGRIASADDIAGPIVFLCSALAHHVTGEVLNVNGGSVLCG
jgi:3-oxoacyl-[acyl-carrier protein] reductase